MHLGDSRVDSNLKPKDDCACGCGLFGTPLKRPEGHVRGCVCPRCMGKRNRAKGDSKARVARKRLGIPGAMSRHEEHWGGTCRVEMKAGKQVEPIATRFNAAKNQSETQRPIGDHRPFLMVAMPEGTSDGIVLMLLSDFVQTYGDLSGQ